MTSINRRPVSDEFGAYYLKYISKVKGNDILPELYKSKVAFIDFLKNIPEEKWDYAYSSGKWTMKESLLHLIDAERVFTYRALRVARGDSTAMPGFDQNEYVPTSMAANRTPASLIAEYEAVRDASIQLFENLPLEAYGRIGVASENPISPLAVAYIIVGHQQHHWDLFLEKYLGGKF